MVAGCYRQMHLVWTRCRVRHLACFSPCSILLLVSQHRPRANIMQVDVAIQEAADFCGGSISCLINNAGIAGPNLNGDKAQ